MVVTSMVSPSIVLQLDWSECVQNIPTAFWSLAPKSVFTQYFSNCFLWLVGHTCQLIPERD